MKKLIVVLAALLACTAFTACGETESGVYTDTDEYTVGVTTETGYVSSWSGIKFTVGGDIVMCSEEDLADIADGSDAVYEMMAEDPETGDVVVISALQLAEGVSLDDYIAAANEEFIEQYMWGNFKVDISDADSMEFGGRSYKCTEYTISLGDSEDSTKIYQRVYRAQLGGYVYEICFAYIEQSGFEALVACFAE